MCLYLTSVFIYVLYVILLSNSVAHTTEMFMNSSFFLPADGKIPVSVFNVLIGLNIIVLAVCLPLNIYVLRLIVTGGNGVASEFFSFNLSVCEIIICFTAVPSFINITCYRNDEKSPLNFFLTSLSFLQTISRPFFQCCVCAERYMAVIHPIIFLKYKRLPYRIVLSIVTWIIVLGFSVLSSFILIRCVYYYILLPEYILVFCVKVICSIAVLKALRKPRPGEKLSVKDAGSNRMKKKAFWVIVIILVSMVITYCPIVMLIFAYSSLSYTQKWISTSVFYYFMIFAGFVHPFLYLHRVGKLPFIPD